MMWVSVVPPSILPAERLTVPSHDKGWATRDERRREWEGTSRHIPTVFLLTSLHSSRIVRRRRSRRLETETSGMGREVESAAHSQGSFTCFHCLPFPSWTGRSPRRKRKPWSDWRWTSPVGRVWHSFLHVREVEIISHLPLISFLTVSQGYEGLEPNRCAQPSFVGSLPSPLIPRGPGRRARPHPAGRMGVYRNFYQFYHIIILYYLFAVTSDWGKEG